MRRNNLALQQKTKIAQKLPSEYEDKILSFQTYVISQRKKHDFPLHMIGNMDETPMFFYMPSSTTVHNKWVKTILIKTTGHEKTHFTVVLACMASGEKLPPMVIFKRKTMPKDKFPWGVLVHVHLKGWMDEEGTLIWIRKIWSRALGHLNRKQSMLVWDQFSSHLTEKVKRRLAEEKTTQAVIPGGLTGILQPLDVCLNKPFKTQMRTLWHDWMSQGKGRLTAKGNLIKPDIVTVVTWVKQAWESIPAKMITRSFLKTSIANKMDGTEDDVLWEDDDSADEEEEENPEADWNTDTKLTAEEWEEMFGDSDEDEFDGF